MCLYKFKKGKKIGQNCPIVSKNDYCKKHNKNIILQTVIQSSHSYIEDTFTFFDEILKFFTIYELNELRYVSKTFQNITEKSRRIWFNIIKENELYSGVLETFPEYLWIKNCIYIEYGILCNNCLEYECQCDDNTITKTIAKNLYKLKDDELNLFNVEIKNHILYKNNIYIYSHLEIKRYIFSKYNGLTNYENYKELVELRKMGKLINLINKKIREDENRIIKENKKYDELNEYYSKLTRNEIKKNLERTLIHVYIKKLNENIRKENIQLENFEQEIWFDNYRKPKQHLKLTNKGREILLDNEFKKQKMKRRSDSNLCSQFINGKSNFCVEHVVAIMKMTNILFSYSHIVYSEYNRICVEEILYFMCKNRNNHKYNWCNAVDEVHSKYEYEFDKKSNRYSYNNRYNFYSRLF